MAKAKQSPGPWVWNKGRPKVYDLEWLTDANGNRVLSKYGDGKMTPDKRLLGAAIDYHEAAQCYIDWVARYAKDLAPNVLRAMECAFGKKLRAASAKANKGK